MLPAGMSSVKKTHYEVLSVKEDASYYEIRVIYKAAILNSHPDKQHLQNPRASYPHHDTQESFLDIQKAWETLCNPISRAMYDDELRFSRQELELASDEVSMREMIVENIGDELELQYECRCGDYFSITSLELRGLGISLNSNKKVELQKSTYSPPASVLLPCGSCSLKIRLILDEDY